MSKNNVKQDIAAYRNWCKEQKHLPLFFQDWWLDIVSEDGDWDAMLYYHRADVVSIFPFFYKKKGSLSYLCMPPFTKFLGPFFMGGLSDVKKQSILQAFLAALPTFDSYDLNVHYSTKNCLPFIWNEFEEKVHYSYILENVNDLESCWEGLAADYRNNKIPRAKGLVKVVEAEDVQSLTAFFIGPFVRKGIAQTIDQGILGRLLHSCIRRGQGQVFQAIDSDGRIHAAAFVVWDNMNAKLLLMADDPGLRSSGAGIYLIWQLIEYAHYELQVSEFDFLGSMIPGVERVRRSFGARQRKYSYLHKASKSFRILKTIKNWLS